MLSSAVEMVAGPARKARGSIRHTLHLRTLDELDGRTRASQRTRELLSSIHVDLGGSERLTQAQRQLAQRAAVLGALLEDYEVRWAAGEPFDLNAYLAGINAQRRVLATLGLERRAKDVTPEISAYLRRKAEEAGND
jgi:hypothetical protein